jgi:hypothetical protein
VATETPSATDRFLDDARASFDAWRTAPILPIVATGLVVLSELVPRGAYVPLGLGIGFFSFGWLGTQLVWYRQVFEGQPVQLGQLIPLTWSFIARYFWLLSLVLIPPIVASIPFAAARSLRPDSLNSLGFRTAIVIYLAIVLALGTFMVPALAFSTRKVREAVPVGLRMIARGWPENWMYVVLPGLAAAALAWIGWMAPFLSRWALGAVSALIALAFTGAIARYYLRHASNSPDPPG